MCVTFDEWFSYAVISNVIKVKRDEETRNLEQQLEEERRKHYEEEQKLWMNIKCEVDQIKVNATSAQPTVEYSLSYDL